MRKFFLILFIGLIIFPAIRCSENLSEGDSPVKEELPKPDEAIRRANSTCRFPDPDHSLQWLKDIIAKGEEDKRYMLHTGNYLGKIYLTSYKSKPVFFIRMAMTGGLNFYLFGCKGNRLHLTTSDDPIAFSSNAEKGVLIYSSVPLTSYNDLPTGLLAI